MFKDLYASEDVGIYKGNVSHMSRLIILSSECRISVRLLSVSICIFIYLFNLASSAVRSVMSHSNHNGVMTNI